MAITAPPASRVRRGFVDVPHGQVHYRIAGGDGPPVVLLHDSPRSSSMHEAMLAALGSEFTAIAFDTPGYGRSTPLPDTPRPEIPDFAAALAQAIDALGIARCPVYGFHTSSKIALQFAIDHPERAARVVVDGLNLPPGGPSTEFITRYMKPYEVRDDGSHLAATWSKARDFHRFFPWFETSVAARLPLDFPDERALHAYSLDMLAAGRHYSSAYSAAMRYLALPRIPQLRAPTVFSCREDDPLYVFLDALPRDLPAGCSVQRMPADRAAWRERIVALLREGSSGLRAPQAAGARDPLRRPDTAAERCGYVDLPSGQMLLRRVGAGPRPPLLLLPESPGSSIGAMPLARELAMQGERAVFVADLPGLGGSDALPIPDLASYAQALHEALRVLDCGPVDVLAEFTSTPLALELARHAPSAVRSLVLDGVLQLASAERRRLWKQYCPPVSPRWDGSHYLSWWHRLRDQELCWPWFDRSRNAIRRRIVDVGGERLTALTLDLARQPEHYGDAARAAFDVDVGPLLAAVTQPALVLHDAEDVRDRNAPKAARRLQAGRLLPRDADPSARARAILGFLAAAAG